MGARPLTMETAVESVKPVSESTATRLRRWAGILSAYFTAQSLTQLAGIAAGLLLVRAMPVREFAFYTLALSVVSFFTFLSDLGSSTALVHFFHRTRREGNGDFSSYFAAVLSLRRIAFLAGTLVVLVAFPGAAAAEGYGARDITLVTGGILLCVWFQIQSSLRVLSLRLADRYGASYRAELIGAAVRLLMVLALIAAAWLQAWLAVLAGAAATAATSWLSRPKSLVPSAVELGPYRRQVLRYLLPTLPSACYFSVQGPLTVWLAATFGATRNIAEVGALSRLGLVVGIFSSLAGVVFLPRLARITDERFWRVRFFQFGGLLLSLALVLLFAAALFPEPFLWLLGERYANLQSELLLVVAGAGLTLLDGYVVNVNLARSWTRWQGLAVASLVATQAILVIFVPLGSTSGVLTFNLLSAAAALAGQLMIAALGLSHPRLVLWR